MLNIWWNKVRYWGVFRQTRNGIIVAKREKRRHVKKSTDSYQLVDGIQSQGFDADGMIYLILYKL